MDLTGFDNLTKEAQEHFGVRLSAAQMDALEGHAYELLEWNQRMNLTRITEPEEVRIKHFLDAFSCVPLIGPDFAGRMIDVGTGGGFPGLPLKVVYPEMELTLADSVGKKTTFLQHVVQELGLRGVQVIQARAEDLGQAPKHREQYDWAVARAVARMPVLVEYLLPLVKVGGYALVQKGGGQGLIEELESGQAAINALGGKISEVKRLHLAGLKAERSLVVIEKIRKTPKDFPRQAGTPNKKPIMG